MGQETTDLVGNQPKVMINVLRVRDSHRGRGQAPKRVLCERNHQLNRQSACNVRQSGTSHGALLIKGAVLQ